MDPSRRVENPIFVTLQQKNAVAQEISSYGGDGHLKLRMNKSDKSQEQAKQWANFFALNVKKKQARAELGQAQLKLKLGCTLIRVCFIKMRIAKCYQPLHIALLGTTYLIIHNPFNTLLH